ncbi:DUF2157 domain-containing protein [Gilvimarinus algae]|uniref:DUF2157 domain-containing protein n=1 Tax=Gilvimarinus algae TaxID=3058037 RepID=A0ABT8TBS6_9GAMM|nr:DUF2157 domain-containing protein [Gilvimarinus sp. SDUM040014]MDO3380828.1 DUF2157 domain-containing protein [Gilvimarinus sp. SDUM040014]
MEKDNRAEAQRRADSIRAFGQELQRLQSEGVLSLETEQLSRVRVYHQQQLESLRQGYDVDLADHARRLSLGMQVVSFLGAWALAASVFFFFQQYWGLLDTWLQVAVLVAAPLLSLVGVVYIAQLDGPARYYAKIAAMISFACLVINIALLGQLYNFPPSPTALAVFAVYAGLLAYALEVRLLLAVAMLCVFAFIGAQSATYSGLYWLSVGERPEHFLLPTLALFFLPSVISQHAYAGFSTIYRVLSLTALCLVLLVLSNWGRGSYLPWSHAVIEGVYQIAGFAVSAGAIWLGVQRGWPAVVATGNVFFFLFLYTKFFDWWWEWLPKSLFFLLLGLTALLALMVFSRLRRYTQTQAGGEQ